MKVGTRNRTLSITAVVAASIIGCATGAHAQKQNKTDDPQLSPMLFGETEKERRDKIRQDQEQQEEAIRVSREQQRDAQQIDDPSTRPLLFGPPKGDFDEEEDDAWRLTLGEEDGNAGFLVS